MDFQALLGALKELEKQKSPLLKEKLTCVQDNGEWVNLDLVISVLRDDIKFIAEYASSGD